MFILGMVPSDRDWAQKNKIISVDSGIITQDMVALLDTWLHTGKCMQK